MSEQKLSAKEHHRQAEELRESDRHLDALKELDQAIVLYIARRQATVERGYLRD